MSWEFTSESDWLDYPLNRNIISAVWTHKSKAYAVYQNTIYNIQVFLSQAEILVCPAEELIDKKHKIEVYVFSKGFFPPY